MKQHIHQNRVVSNLRLADAPVVSNPSRESYYPLFEETSLLGWRQASEKKPDAHEINEHLLSPCEPLIVRCSPMVGQLDV